MSKKKQEVEMSKEMIDSIKNYSKSIQTINDFVQAVRQIPGNYIGPLGNRGFINMIREVYQNAIDELMRKNSPCTKIFVKYDERTNETTIGDNGRGIPFDSMIRVFTNQHTSSNYTKEKGDYTSGLHGLGSKVTNALSTTFSVESYIFGKGKRVDFYDGHPTEKGVYDIPNDDHKQGTFITFRPCYEVMGNITTTVQDVLSLVQNIIFLTTLGAEVNFVGVFQDGKEYKDTIINKDGLITLLILQTTTPLIQPIYISNDTGAMKAECAFTFTSDLESLGSVIGYGNMCPTVSGTHIDGFIDGISRYFRTYMNKIYLSQKSKNKLNIISADITLGLVGCISAFHIKPVFTGQAKEILSNEDLFGFVSDLVYRSLDDWSKSNPKDLQKLCKYFKDIADIRTKADKEKVKISTKNNSTLSGLPSKFVKPQGKKGLELILVEGDSAGGSAKNSRDKEHQGILPLKGKFPNAMCKTKKAVLENEEAAAILTVLSDGDGKNFGNSMDLSKVPWEKIIIMADADPDGKHISTLVLKLLLMYARPVVEAGLLYKAVPPLYSIEIGKEKKYFITRLEYIEFLQQKFTTKNTISTVRGNVLTDMEILNILYNNSEYVYELEKLGNTYSLDYELLEFVLANRNVEQNELSNLLRKNFRFITTDIKYGTFVIEGLEKCKSQLIILDKLLRDTQTHRVINFIDKAASLIYSVNGETKTLYQLMKMFEASAPSSLQRYKGLGEMDPSELAESTLYPTENRVLIRYTTESIIKEIETIKYLEDNKQELIKDLKATRLDLIG